ncbi:MAG: hypothetical protein V3T42_04945 [Nitrospirales bacterium]
MAEGPTGALAALYHDYRLRFTALTPRKGCMLKNETNRATLREISGQALIIPLCDVKKWGNYPMKIVIEGISFYFENSYYRIIQHISNKQKFGNVFPRSMREYPFSRERVKFPSNKKAG